MRSETPPFILALAVGVLITESDAKLHNKHLKGGTFRVVPGAPWKSLTHFSSQSVFGSNKK
jgi:hypothetical protein